MNLSLNTRIEELFATNELSLRTKNSLLSGGIETIGDIVVGYPDLKRLLMIRNFTTRSLKEVEELVKRFKESATDDSTVVPSYSGGVSYLELALNGDSPLRRELLLDYYLRQIRFGNLKVGELVQRCFPCFESLVAWFGRPIEAYNGACAGASAEAVTTLFEANQAFQKFFDYVYQLKPEELCRFYFQTFYPGLDKKGLDSATAHYIQTGARPRLVLDQAK